MSLMSVKSPCFLNIDMAINLGAGASRAVIFWVSARTRPSAKLRFNHAGGNQFDVTLFEVLCVSYFVSFDDDVDGGPGLGNRRPKTVTELNNNPMTTDIVAKR